jgi:hypothetical protein
MMLAGLAATEERPASKATLRLGGMLPIAPWFTRRFTNRAWSSNPGMSSFSSQPL